MSRNSSEVIIWSILLIIVFFMQKKHEFTKIARESFETEICQNQIIYVHVYGLILLARLVLVNIYTQNKFYC